MITLDTNLARCVVRGLTPALVLVAVTGCSPGTESGLAPAPAVAAVCPEVNDVLFHDGAIHTMDAENAVVSSLRVLGDRIVATGSGELGATGCTERVNLAGRTVIPGIIDNHNHIVLLGRRPGHDTRIESARSIQQVLDTLATKAATLPAGEWITSIGGFDLSQFTPAPETPRFPTLAEFDAALPDHPIYLQLSFSGPAVTNSAGKAVFESWGVPVADDGTFAGGFNLPNPTTTALNALVQRQTLDERKRGTVDAMRYAARVGITTHLDEGGFPSTNTATDGAAHMDPYSGYDALLALHAEGALINRIRINFLHMETDPETPQLLARLNNVFPNTGEGLLRVVGIGEFTAGASPMINEATDVWMNGTRRVAEAGWRNENHSLTGQDYQVIIDSWAAVHESLPAPGISESRWVLAHAPFITREYADKLNAIGGGVSVLGGWRYIAGSEQQNGPPFRMLAESGIPMGMSSDGMQISPMNPWLGLYYIVTGRNARGVLINEGQTLPRNDALRLYTAANGWFLNEEDHLGTLEAGKYADLVVLSADYFDDSAVTDDAIRDITSVLTVVGGEVVHGDAASL